MTEVKFDVWSILLLFGAVQGLFFALYLFTRPENRGANKWMAALLTVISLHLLEYTADISGLSLELPILVASTYPLIFCVGPLYYIYCRHSLHDGYRVNGGTLLHFIPALVVLVFMMPFYALSPDAKIRFIQELQQDGYISVPIEQFIFMGVHVTQTILYVSVTYKFISRKQRAIKELSSDVNTVRKLEWLNAFNRYFSIYLVFYFVIVIVLVSMHLYRVQVDYLLLLTTSVAIYAIGYKAISAPEIFRSIATRELPGEKRLNAIQDPVRYSAIKQSLLDMMIADKPYLRGDLRVSELAAVLHLQDYQLSQLINDEFKVNFYDFVNKYRIEDAKKLLVATDNLKVLAIAFEVGFNSKATFNRAFKKFTSFTPSEFKEKFLAAEK